MKRARIVIGANFGDEGKGLVTDWLCASGAQVVVRFNGGANAGHTVVTPDGERHVFHHFGSGSLLDVPTFLSQFFVCNPISFAKELEELRTLGFHPKIFAHPDCLVTTFADMMINQLRETKRGGKRHGSCGVGLHETMQRSRIEELKITMSDLWNGSKRLEEQLVTICSTYCKFRTGAQLDNAEDAIALFTNGCNDFAEYVNPLGIGQCEDAVFEGSQGLLLDQDNAEFFPHLTHSNTGMKNVRTLCEQGGFEDAEIYYVSRTYLTRHGAGKLPGEDGNLSYEDETNVPHPFQGILRFALLDTGLKERCATDANGDGYKLVLTHCDQCAPILDADYYASGPKRGDIQKEQSSMILDAELCR